MSENKRHPQTNDVINDKSQGSVAAHLRCGKIFNSHYFFTNLLLESAVEIFFKSMNIWQARKWIARWWSWAKAVSCDVDDADAYNWSFCELCKTNTAKIHFCQLINAHISRQYFFSDNLNGWIIRGSLILECLNVSVISWTWQFLVPNIFTR